MSLRLVPKSVTLNDLEQRSVVNSISLIICQVARFWPIRGF